MNRLALLSLTLLAACDIGAFAPNRDADIDWADDADWDMQQESNMRGTLQGSHATVATFNDSLSLGMANIGPGWSSVEMHVNGPYGWAMIGVNLDGELGRGALAPGNTVYLNGDAPDADPEADSDDTVWGDTIGCSGPDTWDTVTDELADSTTISITEDPITGDLQITVEADFGDNGVMTGTGTVDNSANRG